MIDLTGKVALVTGGSSGIGRAIAETLSAAGARIVVADLSEQPREGGPTTTELLESLGGVSEHVHLDVSDSTEVTTVFAETSQRHNGIDILVNNAGILVAGTVLETDDDLWRRQMSINLDGTFYCTREMIRQLRAINRGGKIVNISSISGFRGNPGFAAYCASKGAIVNFTRQVALDYAPFGINVNAVAPGFVTTAMTDSYDQPTREILTGQTPRGQWATPKDIANATLFLASDLSDHVVGENILVDGGWTIGTPTGGQ
ncbi:SDR family NAD(P)-dependent oxidoreductase [Rhodococcus erythropolis]|uniref:3-oxoacyl-ACP reductase FabG n=1 Tax=Rhodococcus erythropolis TaxID=1833 RepID=A0A8I0ZR48_RHOER|nr:3-oxoacyl-ACP reductase family protein [Rhodococcus erythropolis]MBH5144085.1 3-oxoacyl-ACP reductase FabG [Rhodococcus erythropolis]